MNYIKLYSELLKYPLNASEKLCNDFPCLVNKIAYTLFFFLFQRKAKIANPVVVNAKSGNISIAKNISILVRHFPSVFLMSFP